MIHQSKYPLGQKVAVIYRSWGPKGRVAHCSIKAIGLESVPAHLLNPTGPLQWRVSEAGLAMHACMKADRQPVWLTSFLILAFITSPHDGIKRASSLLYLKVGPDGSFAAQRWVSLQPTAACHKCHQFRGRSQVDDVKEMENKRRRFATPPLSVSVSEKRGSFCLKSRELAGQTEAFAS